MLLFFFTSAIINDIVIVVVVLLASRVLTPLKRQIEMKLVLSEMFITSFGLYFSVLQC